MRNKMPLRERDLQRKILLRLRACGGWWVKFPAGPFSTAGIPDLIGMFTHPPHRGRLVAIEVKLPGEKPTALQARTLAAIEAAGGISATIDSIENLNIFLDFYLQNKSIVVDS